MFVMSVRLLNFGKGVDWNSEKNNNLRENKVEVHLMEEGVPLWVTIWIVPMFSPCVEFLTIDSA
jgi:hypothetical protein